jgi:hypothetical protein
MVTGPGEVPRFYNAAAIASAAAHPAASDQRVHLGSGAPSYLIG